MHFQAGITSRQIRAARALLDWSQDDLASATHLSIATVRKLELGYISPRHSTTNMIRQTIENAGLEFLESDGVRRRQEDIRVYEGADGVAAFFDDMEQTVNRTGGEILMVAPTGDGETIDARDDYFNNAEKTIASSRASYIQCIVKGLLKPGLSLSRFEFRSISPHYVDPVPFFVYSDKYAHVSPARYGGSKIVVIQSISTAQASRRHFLSMWEKATPFRSYLESVTSPVFAA